MDYKKKLLELYNKAISYDNSVIIDKEILKDIIVIANKSYSQKGVFTVLITLSIYKILHPEQDIRNHQISMENGFSGRSIDTKYITPTLKELELPAMSESGWLTRSLEQPYPYDLNYEGKISDKSVRKSFLTIVDKIQNSKLFPEDFIIILLFEVIKLKKNNKIEILKIQNSESIIITDLINILFKQFSYNYNSFGGSKLPVLAFYSIYKILIKEIKRYDSCKLKELNNHTTSDKSSKSAGDLEIFKNEILYEAIELKLDKEIDFNILVIAKEKIIKYNPQRYYILSLLDIKTTDKSQIMNLIQDVKETHGCQIVVNGIIPTLKYYLRLISDINEFINIYSDLIEKDNELKFIHKEKWNEYLKELIRN